MLKIDLNDGVRIVETKGEVLFEKMYLITNGGNYENFANNLL